MRQVSWPAVPGRSPRPVRTKSPSTEREAMSVRGASRASFADLTERLAAEDISSAAVATRLGDELFAVVGLLDTEHALRRALADPGKPAAEKGAVGGRAAARQGDPADRGAGRGGRRSPLGQPGRHGGRDRGARDPGDGARRGGGRRLDDLEDGLFRFGRVVAGAAGPAGRAGRSLAARGRASGPARHAARRQGDPGRRCA